MKTIKRNYIMSAFAGVLYSYGYPKSDLVGGLFPEGVIPLAAPLAFLVFYLQFLKSKVPREKLLISFIFSTAFAASSVMWITYTMKEFGSLGPPWNYALAIPFAFIAFPQTFLWALVLHLSKRTSLNFANFLENSPFAFATGLTLIEAIAPQLFPVSMGHHWAFLAPYLPLSPYVGVAGYSWITYLGIGLFGQAIVKRSGAKALAAAVPMSVFVIGFFLPLKYKVFDSVNLRIVQANIGNALKLSSEKGGSATEIVESLYLQTSLLPHQGLDLVIWPETAYPDTLFSPELIHKKNIPKSVLELLEKLDSSFLMGGYDLSVIQSSIPFYENVYNTAFYFGASPQRLIGAYHKKKLLPFGETLPFGGVNKILAPYLPQVSFFAKGLNSPYFKVKRSKFMMAICYEILFPQFFKEYMADHNERPNFIVNLTNDSWYGDGDEPYQHLYLGRWRAMELGLPIVRATNTGISTFIRADGTLGPLLRVGEKGVLDYTLKTVKGADTWVQKWGYFPAFALGLLFTIIAWFARRPEGHGRE